MALIFICDKCNARSEPTSIPCPKDWKDYTIKGYGLGGYADPGVTLRLCPGCVKLTVGDNPVLISEQKDLANRLLDTFIEVQQAAAEE